MLEGRTHLHAISGSIDLSHEFAFFLARQRVLYLYGRVVCEIFGPKL
jgi:hypothetical protein